MRSLNGRLRQIEQLLPPPPEDTYTWADLARDVLACIDDGHIVDQPGEKFEMFLSPTMADGLPEDDRRNAYNLIHQAQKIVREIAAEYGWRSPSAAGDHRLWMHYRANSVAELAGVMGELTHEH